MTDDGCVNEPLGGPQPMQCMSRELLVAKYQFEITDVKISHRLVVETELGCDKHLEIKIER